MDNWAIIIYGSSTGIIPSQVNIKKFIIKGQYVNGLIIYLLYNLEVLFNTKGIKIKIDINRATTPPSLLGIERKIA